MDGRDRFTCIEIAFMDSIKLSLNQGASNVVDLGLATVKIGYVAHQGCPEIGAECRYLHVSAIVSSRQTRRYDADAVGGFHEYSANHNRLASFILTVPGSLRLRIFVQR